MDWNMNLARTAAVGVGFLCLLLLGEPARADGPAATSKPTTASAPAAGIRLAKYGQAQGQEFYNYGLNIVPPWADGGKLLINFPEHLEYMPGTRGILRYSDKDAKGHWEVAADGLSAKLDVESVTEPGVKVQGEAKVVGPERIEVSMAIVNGSKKKLGDIRPLYCFQYRGLTGFPQWVDNLKHTFFIQGGKLVALSDIKTPQDSKVKAGSVKDSPQKNDSEFAAKQGGWIEEGVDASISIVTSLNDKRCLVLAWTPGKSAFSNANIPCLHADPYYGTIEPGQTAVAKAVITLSERPKEEIVKELQKEGAGAAVKRKDSP
ncbi:MAG: hypothetical protein ACE15C_05855 [Phycisphaerae bacterium]